MNAVVYFAGMGKRKKKRNHVIAEQPASRRSLQNSTSERKWLWPLVLFLAGLALPYVLPNSDSAPVVYFTWFIGLVVLALIWLEAWKHLRLTTWVGVSLVCITALLFLWAARWSIQYRLRASYVFLVPGVLFDGNKWDFFANHRGPKSSQHVEALFIDEDQKARVLQNGRSSLTPADIDSYQTLWSLPEVNPMGRGNIFAQQLLWKPFNLELSHFTAEITWRDGDVHEDIRIARVESKWQYAMKVVDKDTGNTLVNCNDKLFPAADSLPPCFPALTQPGK
jgi:hypothetical protein